MTEVRARPRFGPGFSALWSASALTGLGDGLRIAALSIYAVSLTSSTFLIAAVTVASRIPWIVVGPFSGALADMVSPWRTLFACNMARAVTMATFVALLVSDQMTIGIVITVAFAMSSIDTLAQNLTQGILPDVAGSRSLESANSVIEGSQQISTDLIGIALGSLLLEAATALPFTADSILSCAAAVLVGFAMRGGRLPSRTSQGINPRALMRDTADGIRWLVRHYPLRTIAIAVCVLNLCNLAIVSIAVLYAINALHIPPGLYGFLLLVIGIGGLLGLLIAPWCARHLGRAGTLRAAFALCPPAFFVGAIVSDAMVASAALSLVGMATSIVTVVTVSIRQDIIPGEHFGKVNAAYRLIVNGVSPIGGIIAGILVQFFGLRCPFFFSAATMALMTLVLALLQKNSLEPRP